MILRVFQKHQETLLQILVFIFCPLSFFFSRSATWVLVAGGLLGFLVLGRSLIRFFTQPFMLIILAFIALGAVSSLWSLDPLGSLFLTLRLFGNYLLGGSFCALFLNSSRDHLPKILLAFVLGMVLASLLILGDYLLGNPWQNFCNTTSAKAFVPLVLMLTVGAWPAAFWLSRRYHYGVSFLFILSIFCLSFLVDCDTAPVSILVGLLVATCAFVSVPAAVKMGQVLSAVLILSLPFLMGAYLTPDRIHQINEKIHIFSHIHRLYVWHDISQKIEKKWALGYGLDTSRHNSLGGEITSWPFTNSNGDKISIRSKAIPMHPHNAPLQWWLELGVMGALLGIFMNYQCLRSIRRFSKEGAVFALGLFASSSCIAWVNLGFWQNWWLSSLWVVGGLMLALQGCSFKKEPEKCLPF